MPRCPSIVEFYHMNSILSSYRVDWTALLIRASVLSCACGCVHSLIQNEDSNHNPRYLATFPLAARRNMLTVTLLWCFIPFHLNTLCITLNCIVLFISYTSVFFNVYIQFWIPKEITNYFELSKVITSDNWMHNYLCTTSIYFFRNWARSTWYHQHNLRNMNY